MNFSDNCLAIIEHYESVMLIPYMCPAGKMTIGYGHVIRHNEEYTHISERLATELLCADADIACKVVVKLITSPLNQDQLDALTSFVFNIGQANFAKSTLLKLLNDEAYIDAAKEFIRWDKIKGKDGEYHSLSGLSYRRMTERDLFSGDGLNFYNCFGVI